MRQVYESWYGATYKINYLKEEGGRGRGRGQGGEEEEWRRGEEKEKTSSTADSEMAGGTDGMPDS